MPFVFQVAKVDKTVSSHFESKTDLLDEMSDYAAVILAQARVILPPNSPLMEYLEKVVAIQDTRDPLSSVSLRKIFEDSQSLLANFDTIKMLSQVLIDAYHQAVESEESRPYNTEVSQIDYIERVKNRLYIMSHILGMFPDFFHEHPQFTNDRITLLSSLFEDIRVQQFNIAYGLYNRFYIHPQSFQKLEHFFVLASGVGETFANGVCEHIKRHSPTELSRLLPVFDYFMNQSHYHAALAFALGNKALANDYLQKADVQNATAGVIFAAMNPRQDAFYKNRLAWQANNIEMFNSDASLTEYRQKCFEMLKAIQGLPVAVSIARVTELATKQNLEQCLKELSDAKTLDHVTVKLITKSFVLSHAVLAQSSSMVPALDKANKIIRKLEQLIAKEIPNPMLVQIQPYIEDYKKKITASLEKSYAGYLQQTVPSINEENRENQTVTVHGEGVHGIVVKGLELPRPACLDQQFQEKIKKIEKECEEVDTECEKIKKEVKTKRNTLTLMQADVESKKTQIQPPQLQCAPLQAELGKLILTNQALDVKLQTILQERASQKTQAHKLENAKTALHVAQQKAQVQVNVHQKALEELKNSLKKQLDKQDSEKQQRDLIEAENVALQNKLEALQKRQLSQTQFYQDKIQEKLKAHQLQLQSTKKEVKPTVQAPFYKEQVEKIEAENKVLALKIEQLKKSNQEVLAQHQQILGGIYYSLQRNPADTKIKVLGAQLAQMQEQLNNIECCIKVLPSKCIEFSGDLNVQLEQDPSRLKECILFNLQLNKPICESDSITINQHLKKLLLTKELGAYLAVFCAIVEHLVPSYGFNKAYDLGIIAQLIPLQWLLPADKMFHNWLHFVGIKLQNASLPINPYFIVNLTLIAPYYALEQPRIEDIADCLLERLPHLSVADKNLLKRNIQIGLPPLCIEFQKHFNYSHSPVMSESVQALISAAPTAESDVDYKDTTLQSRRKNKVH